MAEWGRNFGDDDDVRGSEADGTMVSTPTERELGTLVELEKVLNIGDVFEV